MCLPSGVGVESAFVLRVVDGGLAELGEWQVSCSVEESGDQEEDEDAAGGVGEGLGGPVWTTAA